MQSKINIKKTGTIFNLESRPGLTLVQDNQDVDAIQDYFGHDPAVDEFDGFFVSVRDGDYGEVYGFYGGVPRSYLDVYKVTRTFVADKAKKKPAKKRTTRSASPGTPLGGMR